MAKDVSGLKVGDVVSYETRGGNKVQSKVSEEDPTGFAVTMENGDIITYLDPCSVVERANGEENTGDAEPVKPESEENYTPEGVKCLKCRKEIPGDAPQRQYHESCKLEIKRQKERDRQREKNKGKKKLGEEFLCENCGETTIRKSGKHKYCEKCANGKEYNHKQQYLRKWRGNKNKVGERFQCPDCYKWVTRNSGAQKRCKTCARERENERSREYYRKHEEKKKQKELALVDNASVMKSCSVKTKEIVESINQNYREIINALYKEDRKNAKSALKSIRQLNKDLKEEQNNLGTTIVKLQEEGAETSHYYVQAIGYLREIGHCLNYMAEPAFDHIDNMHKGLSDEQKEELDKIQKLLYELLNLASEIIQENTFVKIDNLIETQNKLLSQLKQARKDQIKRIKHKDTGKKNSMLYLNILQETKNLSLFSVNLIKAHRDFVIYNDSEHF